MALLRQIAHGLRVLSNRRKVDHDLEDELRHYQDQATADYVGRGFSDEDARLAARRDVGDPLKVREDVRDHGWESSVDALLADVRFAGRMVRKTPLFAGVVIFLVSLGSGGVTTVFSAMNALLFRPVPGVVNPGRLVVIRPVHPDGTISEQGSYGYYESVRDRARTLEGVAAWGRVSLTIAADGQGAAVSGNLVSANYFDLLGVRPAAGRFFAPDEDRTPGSRPVVVVSHGFWRARLQGRSDAIGQTVTVNGKPYTLVGVAPEGFYGIYTGVRADAWVPLMMQPHLRPRSNLTTASWVWLFGRLPDRSRIGVAQQELSALAAARAADAGERPGPVAAPSVRLEAFTGLPNGEAGMLLGFMGLLLGAAGLVLLIAGVNVSAMLSARYGARLREMAMRASLGAGRARLVRQLLTEVLTLFLLGAVGGYLTAVLATDALEQLPLPENVPVTLHFELSPDLRVLAFSVAVSIATGLIFGLAPAFRATRKDITSCLRDDTPGAGLRRPVFSRTLAVGQLAASLVLLVVAGLLLRALDEGQRIDPGFDRRGVATTLLEPEAWGYDEAHARAFYAALRDRIEALPGVTAVSYTSRLPLMAGSSVDDMNVDGSDVPVHYASVDTGYFSVMRVPVLQGRAFVRSDRAGATNVAVIDETFARKFWQDGNAVGRTFAFRGEIRTIVGIVRKTKYATLSEATPLFAYFPIEQVWQPAQILAVRSEIEGDEIARSLQRAVLSVDPLLPTPRVSTLARATAIVLLPHRAAAIVTGMLGAIGLLLAAVGLYGVMAFSAGRRTREIGIRVALGASRSGILRMMLWEGLRLAILGITVGLLLAATASRLIAGWLFNLSPLDARTFIGTAALLLAVAVFASYLPAQRAAGVDPLLALRAE